MFDDGHLGYMMTFDNRIVWAHNLDSFRAGSQAHLWLDLGGDASIFIDNEDLILAIARSLTTAGAVQENVQNVPMFDAIVGEWVIESRGGSEINLALGATVVFLSDDVGWGSFAGFDVFDDRGRELIENFDWIYDSGWMDIFFHHGLIFRFDDLRLVGDTLHMFHENTNSTFVLRRNAHSNFIVADTSDWITVDADNVSIDIPPAWSYVWDPSGVVDILSEDGTIHILLGYIIAGNPHEFIEQNPYAPFRFDSGSVGHMFELPESIIWITDYSLCCGVLLFHDGNRNIFTNNEDLILQIARSLRRS